MKKYISLSIKNESEVLLNLMKTLKNSSNSVFTYLKKNTEEYAKNIFVPESNVACFKTRRKSLFESYVWLLLSGESIIVTNIVSNKCPQLGVDDYNIIIKAFYNDFIATFIDDSYMIQMSDDNVEISDIIDEDTYKKLTHWEMACNKETPISHFIDYQNWLDFVVSSFKNGSYLSSEDIVKWLKDDRKWPDAYEQSINQLADYYEYGIAILKYFSDEDR